MTLFEVVRDAFAAGGLGVALWVLYGWLKSRPTANDAPIRVKGGSIEILNRLGNWEIDKEENEKQFHTDGSDRGWIAKVWKNSEDWKQKKTAEKTLTGKRIVVEVEVPGVNNDYQIVFRANGGVRVVDSKGKLGVQGDVLKNATADHRIKKVIARTAGAKDDPYDQFDANNKGHIELWPQ